MFTLIFVNGACKLCADNSGKNPIVASNQGRQSSYARRGVCTDLQQFHKLNKYVALDNHSGQSGQRRTMRRVVDAAQAIP